MKVTLPALVAALEEASVVYLSDDGEIYNAVIECVDLTEYLQRAVEILNSNQGPEA